MARFVMVRPSFMQSIGILMAQTRSVPSQPGIHSCWMTEDAGMRGAESAPMPHITAQSCHSARGEAGAPGVALGRPAASGSAASSAAVPPRPRLI